MMRTTLLLVLLLGAGCASEEVHWDSLSGAYNNGISICIDLSKPDLGEPYARPEFREELWFQLSARRAQESRAFWSPRGIHYIAARLENTASQEEKRCGEQLLREARSLEIE